MSHRKNPDADLKKYYTVFLEIGLIVTLVVSLAAVKIDFRQEVKDVDLTKEQEVVEMEEIVQTKQIEKPPPPPRPPVPVEVPNDEIVEDQVLDINAELDLDAPLDMPPPPPDQEEDNEEDFFVVVENMPELIGGLAGLQQKVRYPEMARKAGIEGRVIIQFIVNEQGKVEDPRVVRGIGGGCDEEALRAVKEASFKPGRQRGNPVRVQYSLPIVFKLQN
ncbi:energy transducer TonB [Aliifodinibius sp. S!AR15-10]|uniref:energy transducer TonB n=1 Tax=Aliifodinibius sp. S!AR15-10 TaxID=2950437 RepID=UPI0028605B30|nr:energy transducer TonB [Aliifodinibius sp. S!AR15-10]MDR8392080.1 energy transducer TonB [Aliifodinibius sp. S!AR15-10]